MGPSTRRSVPACCAGFLVQVRPPPINPQGVRYASVRPLRLRLRGDCGRAPDPTGARAGIGPAHGRSPSMSHDLALAQNHAWSLARTLMVPVILFKVDDEYGVMPADELDDAEVEPLFEYDPYKGGRPAH